MAVAAPRLVPLSAGGRAALLVDAFAPLGVTVAATGAREATLVLDDDRRTDAVPVRLLHRRRAALEVATDGSRFRADGAVAMVAGPRGRVRERVLTFHFAEPELPARRRDPRAAVALPVTFLPVRAELPPARGVTVDVSGGGALVRSAARLPPGAPLTLLLDLPGEELPIPAAGEVVRATRDGLSGVRLDRLRPADRALLARWVLAQRPPGTRS
jgi:hypothetical protein